MGRGLNHTIEHYETCIERFSNSNNDLLKSFVGPMKRTLIGLLKIKQKEKNHGNN